MNPLLGRDGLVDGVEAEKVMMHPPFDEVEQAKVHRSRARKHPARPPQMRPMRGAPQRERARRDADAGVDEAVPDGVVANGVQAIGRVRLADHAVPLERLVQHDPVEEAPEAKAGQDPGRDREAAAGGGMVPALVLRPDRAEPGRCRMVPNAVERPGRLKLGVSSDCDPIGSDRGAPAPWMMVGGLPPCGRNTTKAGPTRPLSRTTT